MIFQFAKCSIDPQKHPIIRDGKPVHVELQVFELLLLLAEKQGQLVTKDELVDTVWQGLIVSDATISARISAARKAVGGIGKDQAIIKTVHGLGFQLIAEVKSVQNQTSQAHVSDPVNTQPIQFAKSSDSATIAFTRSGELCPNAD